MQKKRHGPVTTLPAGARFESAADIAAPGKVEQRLTTVNQADYCSVARIDGMVPFARVEAGGA
jgi:hypothetical protein